MFKVTQSFYSTKHRPPLTDNNTFWTHDQWACAMVRRCQDSRQQLLHIEGGVLARGVVWIPRSDQGNEHATGLWRQISGSLEWPCDCLKQA